MKKRNLLIMLIAFFATVFSLVSFAPTIVKAIKTNFREYEEQSFVYTDGNGYKYNVFPLEYNLPSGDLAVSIAWGEDSNNTPANLTVPSTFTANTHNGTKNCVVLALSKNAFAYCDFEYVTLPTNIMEMKEQSFIGCVNLKEITIPYQVTEIKQSCFLDCRALMSVNFLDEDGNEKDYSTNLESIGDHAFSSCQSLTTFNFHDMSSLTYIGKSAFQGCLRFVRALFPETSLDIQSYAFANCPNMNIAHIPLTVDHIGSYAFADCNKLTLYFVATSKPSYDTNFMKLRTTTTDGSEIPAQYGFSSILVDDYHPDFIFTITESVIRINGTTKGTNESDLSVLQTSRRYATIIGYAGNGDETIDFHKAELDGTTGKNLDTLYIPNALKQSPTAEESLPVSIIGKNAFYGLEFIQKIVFPENLVKIEESAFGMCKNIESVDFESCTKLGEVGPYAFKAANDDTSFITELRLPASLKVIDGFAFSGLECLTSLTFRTISDGDTAQDRIDRPNRLFAIGRSAFKNCGTKSVTKYTLATSTVLLPNSLSDGKILELATSWGWTSTSDGGILNVQLDNNKNSSNKTASRSGYAVGASAFYNSKFFKVVEMEGCTCSDTYSDGTIRHSCNWVSYGKQAFYNTYMQKFISSPLLHHLHIRVFDSCKYLQSALLYADKGYNPNRTVDDCNINISASTPITYYGTSAYPPEIAWKHNVFSKCDNVVVYVNYSQALVDPALDSRLAYKNDLLVAFYRDQQANATYQADATTGSYPDNTSNSDIDRAIYASSSRINVPVYYDVDLAELKTRLDDSYIYLERGTGSDKYSIITNCTLNSATVNVATFRNARIAAGAPVKEVGDCAFAYNDARKIRQVINLPDTIERIGKLAFYSRFEKDKTFTNGGYIRVSTDNASSMELGGKTYTNYCKLPSSIKRIDTKAFLNNQFQAISSTSSNIEYMGAGAFLVTPAIRATSTTNNSKIETFSFANSTYFSLENENMYYNMDNGNSILIGNSQLTNGQTTNVVKSGTIALGVQCLEGLTAKTLTLPSSLTTIYGYALTTSDVEEINGDLSNIKYLSAKAIGEAEAFTDDDHYSMQIMHPATRSNYTDEYWMAGAFRKCQKLRKMNIQSMTSVKAIGEDAFISCSNLEDMFNAGNQFTYKMYNSSTNSYSSTDVKTNGVMDWSGATGLRYIGWGAFRDTDKAKYVHFPTTAPRGVESRLTVRNEQFTASTNPTVLIGDRADQAYPGRAGLNSANHYAANAWKDSTPYYFAEDATDIIPTSASCESVNYWTYDPSDTTHKTFILLQTAPTARAYFANN